MSLTTAITNINTILSGITGIRRVYADPPESISEFPAAMTYIKSGELTVVSAGLARNMHSLSVDIYHARQVLPQAVNESKVWPGLVLAALAADQTLGGAVTHIVWPVRYTAGALRYGGQFVHYGVRFEIVVKLMESI